MPKISGGNNFRSGNMVGQMQDYIVSVPASSHTACSGVLTFASKTWHTRALIKNTKYDPVLNKCPSEHRGGNTIAGGYR